MIFNLPSTCVLCGDPATGAIALCNGCRDDLPRHETACAQCGEPLSLVDSAAATNNVTASLTRPVCGKCQQTPPAVDYTLSALSYRSPVNYLVSRLKFSHQLAYAAILSDLLRHHLLKTEQAAGQAADYGMPELLIPVPLHRQRLVKRGFNQALEIARPLADRFQLPLCYRSVIRSRSTVPQTELDADKRQTNIRGSFSLPGKGLLDGQKHVVIVDDVVTTGATCNELASVLKQSGVERVGVWSVARA